MTKNVCVYCASSTECDQKYLKAGRDLGEGLAKLGFTVVYGGAHLGVMGAVADGALNAQGKVIGWIPKFMTTETLHPGLTEVHEVETIHIRKHGMMMNSNALVALPGGTGTLEELLEAITWKRLKLIDLPIFIVNIDGFYKPLLDLFDNMFRERFMSPKSPPDWIVVESVTELLEKLQSTA